MSPAEEILEQLINELEAATRTPGRHASRALVDVENARLQAEDRLVRLRLGIGVAS